jgi:hypothetical protein
MPVIHCRGFSQPCAAQELPLACACVPRAPPLVPLFTLLVWLSPRCVVLHRSLHSAAPAAVWRGARRWVWAQQALKAGGDAGPWGLWSGAWQKMAHMLDQGAVSQPSWLGAVGGMTVGRVAVDSACVGQTGHHHRHEGGKEGCSWRRWQKMTHAVGC